MAVLFPSLLACLCGEGAEFLLGALRGAMSTQPLADFVRGGGEGLALRVPRGAWAGLAASCSEA